MFLRFFAILIGFFVCAAPQYVGAQDAPAPGFGFLDDSVNKPQGHFYDPFAEFGVPIKRAGFILRPVLTLEQHYDDNILALDNNTRSDFVSVIKPALEIEKPFGRHRLKLYGNADIRRYFKENDDNAADIFMGAKLNLEAHHDLSFPVSVSYEDRQIARHIRRRSSVNDVSVSPLERRDMNIHAAAVYNPNRFILSVTGRYMTRRFENDTFLLSGLPALRDAANKNAYSGALEVGYQMRTGWTPFVRTVFAREEFINQAPGTISRDNDLVRILAGAHFDYKGLLVGSLAAGWEERDYEAAAIRNADGLSYEGEITWTPARKARITAGFEKRRTEDEITQNTIDTLSGQVSLDYELQRQLFARFGVSYSRDEFSNTGREDELWAFEPELVYILSPHVKLGASYVFRQRESTLSGLDMDQNVVMLRLTGAL